MQQYSELNFTLDDYYRSSENEESVNSNDADRAVAGRSTIKTNKWKEYTTHAITVFWRLIFAVIPPECRRLLKKIDRKK